MAWSKKNWFGRQARRLRLSILKVSREARASELKIQTELPERGDQERETSSFWFRRVTTAILLGNGGGIVAIASYLTSAADRSSVSILAYPALTSFFSGALLGFFSYTISFITASLRFDSHMNVFSHAVDMARKAGKKTASTQHDGIFAFLIVLSLVQTFCLIGAGASFYNGSSYILSVIGTEACKDSRESYCFGSPIIFPFVNPRPDLETKEEPRVIIAKPRDFSLTSTAASDGSASRIFVAPPESLTVRDITSSTTVQVVSPDGQSCLFSTPFFADGGPTLVRPIDITNLSNRLDDKGYSFIPVSARLFISTIDSDGGTGLTLINVGFSNTGVFITGGFTEASLSILPFPYGDIKGVVFLGENADPVAALPCLEFAENAGFAQGEREAELLASTQRQ